MALKIKRFTSPEDFWNEVNPHLRHEEAKNSMCLGATRMLCADPSGCRYVGALFDDNKFLSAMLAAEYMRNKVVVASPAQNAEHAKLLFVDFMASGAPYTGLVADLPTAEYYRELFHQDGKQTKINMRHGIFRCAKVEIPKIPSHLKFRKAEKSDVATLGNWSTMFFHEASPHDAKVDGAEFAQKKINDGLLYVIEDGAKLLSMAGYSRDIGTSCSVNFVYTPPELRKNGYASMVTALLTQHHLDNGKNETNLYTDLTNPTSNKIYQQIGYQFVCESLHFGILP